MNVNPCQFIVFNCIPADVIVVAGVKGVLTSFPDLKLLTSEVYSRCVNHFGKTYFGTD